MGLGRSACDQYSLWRLQRRQQCPRPILRTLLGVLPFVSGCESVLDLNHDYTLRSEGNGGVSGIANAAGTTSGISPATGGVNVTGAAGSARTQTSGGGGSTSSPQSSGGLASSSTASGGFGNAGGASIPGTTTGGGGGVGTGGTVSSSVPAGGVSAGGASTWRSSNGGIGTAGGSSSRIGTGGTGGSSIGASGGVGGTSSTRSNSGGTGGTAGTTRSGGTAGSAAGSAGSSGASNCASCSHGITLQSESATAQRGSNSASGTTYSSYQDRCPSNQVLVGYAGTLRDDVYQVNNTPVLQLSSLVAVCGTVTVSANGQVTVTPSSGLSTRGTDSTAGTLAQVCPSNQVVVGFAGHSGTGIDQIGFICASLTTTASGCSAVSVGSTYSFTPVGGTGGTAFSVSCPTGQIALGQSLYTATNAKHVGEDWVSLFGLLCGTPTPAACI